MTKTRERGIVVGRGKKSDMNYSQSSLRPAFASAVPVPEPVVSCRERALIKPLGPGLAEECKHWRIQLVLLTFSCFTAVFGTRV